MLEDPGFNSTHCHISPCEMVETRMVVHRQLVVPAVRFSSDLYEVFL